MFCLFFRYNLIGNAAKFTSSGSVTVTGGISENGKHIFLAVEDTGIGIPKDKFGQIFRAFDQVWQIKYDK